MFCKREEPCEIRESFLSLCGYMLERAKHFTLADWAALKLALISFGALVGASFHRFFRKLAPLLAIVALASIIYTLYRIFLCEEEF